MCLCKQIIGFLLQLYYVVVLRCHKVSAVQVFTVLAAVRSEENRESGLCVSTSGLSNSATCRTNHLLQVSVEDHTKLNFQYKSVFFTSPLSITRIRSAFITVLIRWAMVSMVQSWKESLMVFWIKASVSASIEAVASSKRMICWTTKGTVTGDEETCWKVGVLRLQREGKNYMLS